MTICLINFPTKKLPVKVPSIVTTVSHSSLHWTLSLLSASCDKVKFKHPDFVEKFATDWLSAQEGELETEDWREILIAREAVGPPGMVQPRSGQGPDWRQYVHAWVLSPQSSLSRNVGGAEPHGVNQANHQPPTPSASFQGVTKFLGLEWWVFIQSQ